MVPKTFGDVASAIDYSVTEALRILLSEKHLYQSVVLDESIIRDTAEEIASGHHKRQMQIVAASISPRGGGAVRSVEKHVEEMMLQAGKMLDQEWSFPRTVLPPVAGIPNWGVPAVGTLKDYLEVNLAHIHTTCPHCRGRWPFNPLARFANVQTSEIRPTEQWFLMGFQCQNCKKEPVRFLVHRSGRKLTLSGRDPIETVEVSKVIPKPHNRYISAAIVAAQCGQVLSGIFQLRVFVEQFWRSHPQVLNPGTEPERRTGDELGEAYKNTLPEDFRQRFPTLREVYGSLSAAIHTADASEALFSSSLQSIETHFEARRLYKLDG